MSVELGETEGRERLSATPDSGRLAGEIEDLLMIVAGEAGDRWRSLTSDFHLEASTESEDDGPNCRVFHRVRELLKSRFDNLILQFWSVYEKRLQAEAEFQEYARKGFDPRGRADYLDGRQNRIAAISPDCEVADNKTDPARNSRASDEPARVEPKTVDGVMASGSSKFEQPGGGVSASLRAAARQAAVMPILDSKRWKRGRWATEAGVGKNSVYEYLDGKRVLTDANRQAMAEALGLKPTDLPE